MFPKIYYALLIRRKPNAWKLFQPFDVYPVTCEELSNNRSDFEILKEIIEGGAKIIQLRDKSSSKRNFYEKAVQFREETRRKKILLIINDHLDIAAAIDADGVHLGTK